MSKKNIDITHTEYTPTVNTTHNHASHWTMRTYKAFDTDGKGYLVKKDILQVLKD